MGRLEGQVVAITGGASGLGRAIVERFINEGALLGVLDRSKEGCAELEAEFGDGVLTVSGDVRSLDENKRLVKKLLKHHGRLDCAIGNAGIWDYNIKLVDMEAEKLESSFRELFEINVLAYIALAKASLSALADSKGSLIYTLSNAAFWPSGGGVLYTGSKHAVAGIVRQLAYELAPHIRVNGVAPGGVNSQLKGPESLDMHNREFPGELMAASAAQFIPLGKMPSPAEYAGAYVFFASREDNIPATGTILNFDGGFAVRGLGPVPRGGDDLLAKL